MESTYFINNSDKQEDVYNFYNTPDKSSEEEIIRYINKDFDLKIGHIIRSSQGTCIIEYLGIKSNENKTKFILSYRLKVYK